MRCESFVLFNAAVAAGTSVVKQVAGSLRTTFFIAAAGGSVGATVTLYGLGADAQWYPLASATVLSSAGLTAPITIDGVFTAFQAIITSYTAGSITVSGACANML